MSGYPILLREDTSNERSKIVPVVLRRSTAELEAEGEAEALVDGGLPRRELEGIVAELDEGSGSDLRRGGRETAQLESEERLSVSASKTSSVNSNQNSNKGQDQDQDHNSYLDIGTHSLPSEGIMQDQITPSSPVRLLSTCTTSIPSIDAPLSHTARASKPRTIAPLVNANNGLLPADSIPNSLRDLQSMARSVGSGTLRPAMFGQSVGGSTLRPGLSGIRHDDQRNNVNVNVDEAEAGARLPSSFTTAMRQFATDLAHQETSSVDQSRGRGSMTASSHSSTLRGLGGKGGIDEVEVEWCYFCGRSRAREQMELKQVQVGLTLRIHDLDYGQVVEDLQGEVVGDETKVDEGEKNDDSGGAGAAEAVAAGVGTKAWQWVCKGGCAQFHAGHIDSDADESDDGDGE